MGRIFSALALCAALLLSPQAASAQSGPIKFIIGTAPGGAIDPYARLIADPMAKALGQSIIIDYKPGANGNASAQYIADQPADGLLIWVGTQAFTEINPSAFAGQRWSIDDFTPFVRGVEAPLVFVVHPDVPAKTFAEFLAWARQNKGKLSYSSYQPGTPSHFLGYQLNEKFDLDLTHVPFRGSGLQATALVAGHTQFGFAQLNNTAPQHLTGKLRILAVTGPTRDKLLPDVPTLIESGYPGFVATSWVGFFTHAKTSDAIVTKLNGAIGEILKNPDIQAKLKTMGLETTPGSAADAQAFLQKEIDNWGKMVRAIGASVE